jgi:predicted metalloprotease
MSRGVKAGIGGGIGGILLIALITFLGGGDLGDVVQNVASSGVLEQTDPQTEQSFSEEEQQLAKFSRQILAATEDILDREIQRDGLRIHSSDAGSVHQFSAERLWLGIFGCRSVLLFRRPKNST